MKKGIIIFLGLFLLLCPSCDRATHSSSSSGAENVVENFCESYFSLHFADAMTYCTESSKKWLTFAASNIHESDLEVLRSSDSDLSVRVMELQAAPTDSTGFAMVRVRNYLCADRIDAPSTIAEEGFFRIDLEKHAGKWQVRMAGPLQSEKQNPD